MIIKIKIELPNPGVSYEDMDDDLGEVARKLSEAVRWNCTSMVFGREPSGPIWWHDELVGRWERS